MYSRTFLPHWPPALYMSIKPPDGFLVLPPSPRSPAISLWGGGLLVSLAQFSNQILYSAVSATSLSLVSPAYLVSTTSISSSKSCIKGPGQNPAAPHLLFPSRTTNNRSLGFGQSTSYKLWRTSNSNSPLVTKLRFYSGVLGQINTHPTCPFEVRLLLSSPLFNKLGIT